MRNVLTCGSLLWFWGPGGKRTWGGWRLLKRSRPSSWFETGIGASVKRVPTGRDEFRFGGARIKCRSWETVMREDRSDCGPHDCQQRSTAGHIPGGDSAGILGYLTCWMQTRPRPLREADALVSRCRVRPRNHSLAGTPSSWESRRHPG